MQLERRHALLFLLCLPLTVGASGLVLTPAQKTEALDTHNRLRRSVSPSAADMNFLTWNPYLEELAQQAANRCVFEHNYNGPYQNLGENIYQGFRTNLTDILTFFFMEKLAYDYPRKACDLSNSLNLKQCGHYIQLVGAAVSEVGCAIAECATNKFLMFCEYNR
uniref:SCP domain-containing protein n=1 Tax=Macrostomum lignano TaxID=282301 RepID=A0A1I8HYG7_9PLAT